MKKWWKVMGIVLFPFKIIWWCIKFIFDKTKKYICGLLVQNISVDKLDNLSGEQFEDFLFYTLNSAGIKVSKTKTTGDFGADLIVKIHSIKIAIQCKLYYKHSVGNSAVQEVLGAITHYNCDVGLVVTNSTFSRPARILANECDINLVDRYKLEEFLQLDKRSKVDFLLSLKRKKVYMSDKINNFKLLNES